MNKLKKKKGFFPLWLGMQEAICGYKPKSSIHSDEQSGDDDDQLPDLGLFIVSYSLPSLFLSLSLYLAELGISDNQQRQLGLLFYVLYGNSLVLFSPNSSLINGVISKANDTFVLLDTITRYAHEWTNVSTVLKSYFLANGTEKKVASLRRVRQQFFLCHFFLYSSKFR
jgi:hypothetical protein